MKVITIFKTDDDGWQWSVTINLNLEQRVQVRDGYFGHGCRSAEDALKVALIAYNNH